MGIQVLLQRAEVQSSIEASSAPQLVRSPGVREIERLRDEWESLPVQTPMQLFIWAQACAEAFTNGTVQLITAGTTSIRGIAALFQPSQRKELVALGAELYEQADFPVADESAAGELAEVTAKLKTPVFLNDLGANSAFLKELRRACGRRLIVTPRPGHPWIDLDDSWLEPESHLNAGRRSDLRRARRNAEKMGRVEVTFGCPCLETIGGVLDEVFRIEAANWKGRQGSALALDHEVGTFYRRFSVAACKAGILRIGMLRINGKAVATQLAVVIGDDFWLFKMGYDEEYARCSPGQLLMIESFRYARESGSARYELTGRSEPWNQIWTQQLHPAVRVRLHPAGVRGWIAAVNDLTLGNLASKLRQEGRSI